MSRVLNGNLIVLKWQNIRMVSNIKQRERERERERERAKPGQAVYFTFGRDFPTSKQGRYLIGGNCFHKNVHLRCLKRF